MARINKENQVNVNKRYLREFCRRWKDETGDTQCDMDMKMHRSPTFIQNAVAKGYMNVWDVQAFCDTFPNVDYKRLVLENEEPVKTLDEICTPDVSASEIASMMRETLAKLDKLIAMFE